MMYGLAHSFMVGVEKDPDREQTRVIGHRVEIIFVQSNGRDFGLQDNSWYVKFRRNYFPAHSRANAIEIALGLCRQMIFDTANLNRYNGSAECDE